MRPPSRADGLPAICQGPGTGQRAAQLPPALHCDRATGTRTPTAAPLLLKIGVGYCLHLENTVHSKKPLCRLLRWPQAVLRVAGAFIPCRLPTLSLMSLRCPPDTAAALQGLPHTRVTLWNGQSSATARIAAPDGTSAATMQHTFLSETASTGLLALHCSTTEPESWLAAPPLVSYWAAWGGLGKLCMRQAAPVWKRSRANARPHGAPQRRRRRPPNRPQPTGHLTAPRSAGAAPGPAPQPPPEQYRCQPGNVCSPHSRRPRH